MPTRRAALAGLILLPGAAVSADDTPKPARDYPAPKFVPKKKPPLGAQLVEDFVIFAHSELDMVEKLLAKEPRLAVAAVDWGLGDFETGLGGASHMGRRDIAEYLLKRGARPDLFTAAMLGQLEVVKALLTFEPTLIDAKGPHGFGLHWHAKAGGEPAAKTLDYLQGLKPVELPANLPGMPVKK